MGLRFVLKKISSFKCLEMLLSRFYRDQCIVCAYKYLGCESV